MRHNPEFWGAAGAGILFVCEEDDTIFLMHRSPYVEQPGTWGLPGGSVSGEAFYDSAIGRDRPSDDAFWEGAQVEVTEECGSLPQGLKIVDVVDFKQDRFIFRNFICAISKKSKDKWTKGLHLNWENDGYGWVKFGTASEVTDALPKDDNTLHFGIVHILDTLNS